MRSYVLEHSESVKVRSGSFAKCALMQTWPLATLRASSLRASGPVPMTGNNCPTALSVVASFNSAHEGRSSNDMRVAANHKQDLETCLSTCTEPCIQGSIATPENQLAGFLPHTKPNRRPFGYADLFPGLSGQSAARLITAKERPLMRGEYGAV